MTAPVTEQQISRVLDLLSDGNPHKFTDLAEAAGTMHLNTIACELRARGHKIRDWRVPLGYDEKRRPVSTWYFRLVTDSTLDAAGVLRAVPSAASSVGGGPATPPGSAVAAPEFTPSSSRVDPRPTLDLFGTVA